MNGDAGPSLPPTRQLQAVLHQRSPALGPSAHLQALTGMNGRAACPSWDRGRGWIPGDTETEQGKR